MAIKTFFDYTAADIDLDTIEKKLWNIRRFAGHPQALMVRPHTVLVKMLAIRDNASEEVVEWCYHHDDHEGIIGDIIGPVESLVREHSAVLDILKVHLDVCICMARGIPVPTANTRTTVHFYDKLAESLEWQFGLGKPDGGFHPAWPAWLDRERAALMFEKVRNLNP